MKLHCTVVVAFIMLAACHARNDTPAPPNIIFILADDLGQSQLGCYGGPYQTPHIDRFAKQGMRFTQAYSSAAICSPTRAALMTGNYPARLHLTDFIKGSDFPDSLLVQPDWQKFLPPGEITIAEALRDRGYRTAAFGKWHLSQEKSPPESRPYNPDKQGFDEYMITYKPVRGETDPEHDPHNVDSITDRSIRFLEEHGAQPFFLYVSHNAIHDPVMEAAASIAAFEGDTTLEAYQIQPVLAAMVARLDEATGRLLDKVEALGLAENTIVVFYGDNGGRERYASQHPYRKGKGWLYEGGIRVPLLVRWPAKVEAASTEAGIVSSIDFFPTLLEAAGGDLVRYPTDGQSFFPALRGRGPVSDHTHYWHYPHYHRGSGMKPASALRKGKYKLIEWHEPLLTGKGAAAYELYNLEDDVSETINLNDSLSSVSDKLKKELAQWKQDVGAQMPTIAQKKYTR